MINDKLIINQSLHGYDQGHNLIQSSLQFNSEIKRLLLIMSDMSGPNMQKGFEECITGYPLKELNMYALTKTWYAYEMKRPGCVWSHSLFINFSDLAKLTNISKLLHLFKRPSNDIALASYNEVIELQEQSPQNSMFSEWDNSISQKFIKLTLQNLYKNPESSILIQTTNPIKYEFLILSIWMQQWPRLKRSFTFCTGAITPRTLNNQILDLQVISKKLDRNLNSLKDIIIENDEVEISPNESEIWTNLAYNDLSCSLYNFRSFLNYFGTDAAKERAAFIPLVEMYLYFNNQKNYTVSEIVKTVSKYFPSDSEGSLLKQSILCPNIQDFYFDFPKLSEEKILYELATTDYYSSFDFQKLDFSNRFKLLYKHDPDSVLTILNQLILTKLNPNGELVLSSIAEVIEDEQIRHLLQNYKNLLFVLVYFNNELAYKKDFWDIGSDKQKEVFFSLLKIKTLNWQKVFNVLLELNIELDNDVLSSIKFDITKYVLNWLNQNQYCSLSNSWHYYLKSRPLELINWLKNCTIHNPYFYQLIPYVLNPNSPELSKIESQIWIKAISNSNQLNLNSSEILDFKTFLFAFTLKYPDNSTLKLLSFTFDQVYHAALNDELDYKSWKWIEIHTRPLPLWQEWDKCKKLRNLLVDIFLENKWDIEDIKLIVSNPSLIKELKSIYRKR
jgi:hypothetical protein